MVSAHDPEEKSQIRGIGPKDRKRVV